MPARQAGSLIRAALTSWPQVSAHPHRFGGTEYRLGQREIGHVHGDAWVDIPFPTRVRDALIAAGRAEPHHILPESGWVTFYINNDEDVAKAITLFHDSYEIAMKQVAARQSNTA